MLKAGSQYDARSCVALHCVAQSYAIGYKKTCHVAQKIKIDFISALESTKHTDYTAALSVVIAHSFPEL